MYRLRDINAIALCYCHFYYRDVDSRTWSSYHRAITDLHT